MASERKTEGSACSCASEAEHLKLIDNINNSFKQDFDRYSVRRRSAPTSETMRAKVLSKTNGHT